MYCKEIEFEDYDGNLLKEKHYFYMNETEILEWITTNGDYSLEAVLNKMVEKKRGKDILDAMKDLIYRSYGERRLDSRRFDKSEETKMAFMESNAFSALFMELITDASKAAEFINGIIPKKMAESLAKTMSENPNAIPDSVKEYVAPMIENKETK